MQIDSSSLFFDLERIRKSSPLIHNITNYVVMQQTANALLAIGASPVMAHAIEEVEEMVELSQALVLNVGTLSPDWVEAMEKAIKRANQKGVPVVLDPVGVGATVFRKESVERLFQAGKVAVIRGNAGEIASLVKEGCLSKGVDTLAVSLEEVETAKTLARKAKSIVLMSGAWDVITDGESVFYGKNGDLMMTRITGMGCTLTALTGAFLAVNQDPFIASVHAAVLMGVSGEIALERSVGPASFQGALIDALYQVTLQQLEEKVDVVFSDK